MQSNGYGCIYTYIGRERKRERPAYIYICFIYINIYIYIYLYIHGSRSVCFGDMTCNYGKSALVMQKKSLEAVTNVALGDHVDQKGASTDIWSNSKCKSCGKRLWSLLETKINSMSTCSRRLRMHGIDWRSPRKKKSCVLVLCKFVTPRRGTTGE